MPNKPLRPCSKQGCSVLVVNKYCDKHTPDCCQGRGNAHQRGYNYKWQKYRLLFLAKNPLCIECMKQDKLMPATVVDHIIDHKGNKDIFWDTENHQALCETCHNRKTARTYGDKGKNMRR